MRQHDYYLAGYTRGLDQGYRHGYRDGKAGRPHFADELAAERTTEEADRQAELKRWDAAMRVWRKTQYGTGA